MGRSRKLDGVVLESEEITAKAGVERQNPQFVSQNFNVLNKLLDVFMDIYEHDGYGGFQVEVKILKRRQKEVIIYAGKQYRFVLDYESDANIDNEKSFVALPINLLKHSKERRLLNGQAERRRGVNRRHSKRKNNFKLERRAGQDRRCGLHRRVIQLARIDESDVHAILSRVKKY